MSLMHKAGSGCELTQRSVFVPVIETWIPGSKAWSAPGLTLVTGVVMLKIEVLAIFDPGSSGEDQSE